MIALIGPRRGRSEFADTPLPQAHALVRHFVRPGLSWLEGAAAMRACLPAETNPDLPAPWYRAIAATHGPGMVPPGTGPFYLPEWVADPSPDESPVGRNAGRRRGETIDARLRRAGFRLVVAHVVVLRPNADYLAAAKRMALRYPWTVHPQLYWVYLYPSLRATRGRDERPFTTRRWIPGER